MATIRAGVHWVFVNLNRFAEMVFQSPDDALGDQVQVECRTLVIRTSDQSQ